MGEKNISYFVEYGNGRIKSFEYFESDRKGISLMAMLRDMETMSIWLAIVNGITIPILIYILYRLFHVYRKSFYTPFLVVITVLGFAESVTTWIYALTDIFEIFEFKFLCQWVSFIRFLEKDATHWIWAAMYFQRYLSIFYPMLRLKKHGIWKYINDTKILILVPVVAALIATTITLLQRNQYHIHFNDKIFTVCNVSVIWISKTVTDIIRGIKLMYAFFIPFLIIVVLDFAVVFRKHNKIHFSNLTSINSRQEMSDNCSYKIVSHESIKMSEKRRQQCIKNCFIITTMQAMLNFPIYFHTLLYQCFYLYKLTPKMARKIEIIVFVLYFLQLPLKAVAIHLLCRSYCTKIKKNHTVPPTSSSDMSESV